MAYKNALAALDHGGGKGVILGDPTTTRSETLIRAYGRFIASLSGRYVTACDVGTTVADMDLIARETRFATGRSPAERGAGDSGVLTAFGAFQGIGPPPRPAGAMRRPWRAAWRASAMSARSVGPSSRCCSGPAG
jgi:valine dehydrogenase (NAD+)